MTPVLPFLEAWGRFGRLLLVKPQSLMLLDLFLPLKMADWLKRRAFRLFVPPLTAMQLLQEAAVVMFKARQLLRRQVLPASLALRPHQVLLDWAPLVRHLQPGCPRRPLPALHGMSLISRFR